MAYLAHAAVSPPSLAVRDAARALMDDYARRGSAAFPAWQEQRNRLRESLAKLVGCAASELAFIPNTTQGVIDIALCFPWESGDVVIVFEGEFPANVTPWQRAAALFGLDVRMLPVGDYEQSTEQGLSRLEAELARGGVRLVAVSAVQFQTGLRMPISEMARLCHAQGAQLFVDGIQAMGVVPIDLSTSDVDYLACGSHKWLMGLEGAGFLFVHSRRLAALRPRVAGWLSHTDGLRFLFEGAGHLRYDRPIKASTDFFESGNYNSVSLAGLEAAVEGLRSLSVPAIFAHVSRYLDVLESGLVARGFSSLRARERERQSGILGVRPPPGAPIAALHGAISRRSVACSMPDGILRFAPHWPNNTREIPGVLDAIDAALRDVRRP
jgi:selenocysteine lyase/cysteine desulfurase